MYLYYTPQKRILQSGKYSFGTNKFTAYIRKFTYSLNKKNVESEDFSLYRDRLEEIRKEKGLSNRIWSEESGVSLDTIGRIIHPENPDKDSPRVNTLEDLCKPLGVELWEIFYIGEHSFVALQAELLALREERDKLLAKNAVQSATIDSLKEKVDSLKDQIIDTHNYYMRTRN